MNKVAEKVVCVSLGSVFITLSVIAMDKPEINVPPNSFEPHEAPSNHAVPQWYNNVVVASTATSGTINTISYNIS